MDGKYKVGYYNRNLVLDYATNHKYTSDDFNFSWKESRPYASTAWINVSVLKDYLILKGYEEELIFFNSIEDLKNNYDKYGIKCGDVAFLAYNENGENKGAHGAIKATLYSVNVVY